jgi:hypothetical protein
MLSSVVLAEPHLQKRELGAVSSHHSALIFSPPTDKKVKAVGRINPLTYRSVYSEPISKSLRTCARLTHYHHRHIHHVRFVPRFSPHLPLNVHLVRHLVNTFVFLLRFAVHSSQFERHIHMLQPSLIRLFIYITPLAPGPRRYPARLHIPFIDWTVLSPCEMPKTVRRSNP